MVDDFTIITQPDQWLGWLGEDPAKAIRDGIEEMLQQQVPTATLQWVRLVGRPESLAGGLPRRDDPNLVLVKRAALAVSFELQVRSEGREDLLSGVFSWVATGLDANRSDRTFLDLDEAMEWAAEMLTIRIYELDLPEQEQLPEQSHAKTRRWWEFWQTDS